MGSPTGPTFGGDPIWFRTIVVIWLATASLMASEGAPRNRFAAPGRDRPNFLLLLSDDQTFRALGTLGELEVQTPNLDRLARRGLLFTHAFNPGGWSGAVCIPSRAMLNTGRMIWTSRGSGGESVTADGLYWGEALGRAGYDTYMAGKWHLTDAALKRSFQKLGPLTGGFLPSTETDGAAYRRPASNNTWSADDPKWKGHWLQFGGRTVHSTERIAQAAIDYLGQRTTHHTRPFFMYVAFNAPHDPRQAPTEFLQLYRPEQLRLPPNLLGKHPFLIEKDFEGRDEILAPFPRTPAVVRAHLREYYAIISHLDAHIGRVLDALEASGEADNTVVCFTSDQGLAIGQHGLMGKQSLYEHSLRVPFILSGPGVPRGVRSDALFYLQSLYATTCDMAQIPVPSTVWFPSLVPLISGRTTTIHESLYGAFLDRQRSVRTREWKWIRTPASGQTQLFDVLHDPWETRNLARDPQYASIVTDMDRRLREWMLETGDPLPPGRLVPGNH